MEKKFPALTIALIASLSTSIASLAPVVYAEENIKVLITDGPQKAHNHQETTPVLKQILNKDSRFEVDHSLNEEGCEDGSYRPDFSKYDVVVMNEGFGAADWPAATQKARRIHGQWRRYGRDPCSE